MEAWVHLIPEWIVANILDQLVLPKLQVSGFWTEALKLQRFI